MHKHRVSSPAAGVRERYRVIDLEGLPFRWVDADGLRRLINLGVAKVYGTRRVIHGLRLTVTREEALSKSEGRRVLTKPRNVSGATYREHVGERWYIFQHCGAAA